MIASVVRNLLSTAVVFALAFAIGYRSPASFLDWLAAIAILALFVLALSWVAALLGILAGSPEAANGLAFPVMFLAYPSSAFVPVATMPAGLRAFAQNQPETQVIDTVRALFSGTPVGSHALLAIAWSLAITASSLILRWTRVSRGMSGFLLFMVVVVAAGVGRPSRRQRRLSL